VVGDMVERAVDQPAEPTLYVPSAQHVARTRSLVVRTAGAPESAFEALQATVWSIDPDIPLFGVETMEALVDRRVGSFAVIAGLMGAFAALSLVLGGVGIYGVTAYAVGQRTGEIGVRMALGAERSALTRMLLRQGGVRAGLGLALGLGAAFALSSTLSGVLVGVGPRDPTTFGAVAVTLAAISLLALWLPIRRVTRIHPGHALAADR
jgi:ABC-type antimicrobial peptide transport system permease subunit